MIKLHHQMCRRFFFFFNYYIYFILKEEKWEQNNVLSFRARVLGFSALLVPCFRRAGTGFRDAEPRLVWEPLSVRTALKWKICLRLSLPRALQGNSGRLRGVSHLMMCKAASALICRASNSMEITQPIQLCIISIWYLPRTTPLVLYIRMRDALRSFFIYSSHMRRRHE